MNVPPHGDTFKRALMNSANLKVKAQDTPNMTVKVSEGGFWNYTSSATSYVECVGGNSTTITAPVSNAIFVVIALNTTGNIVNIEGSSAVSPTLPTIPRGRFPLAAIYLTSTTTEITEDMIFDLRPDFELSVKDHRDLQSTSVASSHPASAITFAPGSTGLVSTNIQNAIEELKTVLDDAIAHAGSSGTSGTSGSGTSGTSGSGTSGTSGSGTSGSSGTSGLSGSSGTSGTSI